MRTSTTLLFGAASLLALTASALGQGKLATSVSIPAEDVKDALDDYIRQTGVQLIYDAADVPGLNSREVNAVPAQAALMRMLEGTGLAVSRDVSGAVVVARAAPVHRPYSAATEAVIVTGSRIRNSHEPSTPVISLPVVQLLATTPGGVSEALDKMPVLAAGSTPNNATTGANGRGHNAPGYFLNLRNLGAIRTLVLQDGHRVAGTFYDTTVNVDMLPQMLMSRVEIATGGASAVYGSDAVAGVVNFILDKQFDGFKAVTQGGTSEYGDTKSLHLGVAGGQDLIGGHLIWSLEYRNRAALPDASKRPLGALGTSIVGAGTANSPYILVTNIRAGNSAPGGLVVSGPGKGLQFLGDGSLNTFDSGTPTPTSNFSIGGDGGIEHNEYLLPVSATGQTFAYYSHPIGNAVAYLEARYALARTYEAGQAFSNINGSETSTNGSGALYPITIYNTNPFLTPGARARLFPAGGPTSFQMNRTDNDLMSRLSLDQHTGAFSVGAGLNGIIWEGGSWDLAYSHGETRTQLTTRNNVNTAHFYAALDATNDPATGDIVCNVILTAPGAFPGCAPLNLFGQSATVINGSNASQAALNYIADTTWWVAHNGLDDMSASVAGPILIGWAGPIRAAAGVEYRNASLDVRTTTPDNSFNPKYLRLAPPGTFASTDASPEGTFPLTDRAYFKEVQSGAQGSENISEANFELEIPVLQDISWADLFVLNVGARYTEYHVSGEDPASRRWVKAAFSATTWKLGAEWQINDSLKFRAARSRDIRAPTLWDLFQGPVITTSGVTDSLTGLPGAANTKAVGNPALRPEIATNTTAGLVYQPAWLPELRLTADYFHVSIIHEIAAVNGNNLTVQSLCLASDGRSSYCALIQRPISFNSTSPLNFPLLYYSQTLNSQSQWTEGVDFEVDYHAELSRVGLDGAVDLRLLWTHTSFLKTLDLPGSVVTDLAGSASTPAIALPNDKSTLMLTWSGSGTTVDVMERYYSALRQNSNPTIVYAPFTGGLPAWFQTDISVAHEFIVGRAPTMIFLNVSNLLDAKPDVFQVPSYTSSPGMNYPVLPYEDIIGRYFTLGLKFRLN